MKVIIINEECHGFIGVADSVIHAIDFLINEDWLNENTNIYRCVGNGKWIGKSLKEKFGANWKQIIKQFCLEDFNDVFEGGFLLWEEVVYTGGD